MNTGSHRGVIDPDAYVCTIEQDIVDSRIAVVKSTVRPFDRQRARNVRRRYTDDVIGAARINLVPGRNDRPRSAERIARTISSRRP